MFMALQLDFWNQAHFLTPSFHPRKHQHIILKMHNEYERGNLRWGTAEIDCNGCSKNESVHDFPVLLLFLKHLLLATFLISLWCLTLTKFQRPPWEAGSHGGKKATKKTSVSSVSYLALDNLHAPVILKAPHLLRNTALDFLVIINSCFYTVLVFPLNLEKSQILC